MSHIVAQMRDVSFSYDGIHPVLKSISLEIEAGARYALVGPNGAGKSTILGLLTGVLTPSSGTVTVMGDSPNRIKEKTACVRQNLSLFPHLSVSQNIWLNTPECRGSFSFSTKRSDLLARALLESIGCNISPDSLCSDLSFPARQKVEIARALAITPSILFLDEPTSALDSTAREDFYEVLGRVSDQGIAVVLVSHDPVEVDKLKAKPVFIANGKLLSSPLPNSSRLGLILESQRSNGRTETVHSNPPTNEAAEVGLETPGLGQHGTWSHSSESRCRITLIESSTRKATSVSVEEGCPSFLIFEDAMARSEAISAIGGRYNGSAPWFKCAIEGSPKSRGIRVMSVDRLSDHLFPSLSVVENVLLISRVFRERVIRSRGRERRVLKDVARITDVQYNSPRQRVGELSGGNQQRLLLASLLYQAPGLLVLEEPLMGLDESSQRSTLCLLEDLAAASHLVVVATCFGNNYENMRGRRVII